MDKLSEKYIYSHINERRNPLMKTIHYQIKKIKEFNEILNNIIEPNYFIGYQKNKKDYYINLRSSKHQKEMFLIIIHTKLSNTTLAKITRKLKRIDIKEQKKRNNIKPSHP